MKAMMPWTGMGVLRAEMDRLFERFWDADLPAWPAVEAWMPKVDVADTKDAFVAHDAGDEAVGGSVATPDRARPRRSRPA